MIIDLDEIEDEVGTYEKDFKEAPTRETETDWDNCYNVKSPDDRIELISINPSDGSVFAVGETVNVRAELKYNLDSHDEARVELWFELPQNRGGGSAGFADIKVSGGSDTVIVEGSFEVPDLNDVYIEFSLEPPQSAYNAYTDCWESLDREFAGNYFIEGGSREVRKFERPEKEAKELELEDDECYNVQSPNDKVELISIDPPAGSIFAAGESVNVRAELRYTLDSHDEAVIGISYDLQPDIGGSLRFAENKISRGSGVVVIEGDFVPELAETEIGFILLPPVSVYYPDYDCAGSLDSGSTGTYIIEGKISKSERPPLGEFDEKGTRKSERLR